MEITTCVCGHEEEDHSLSGECQVEGCLCASYEPALAEADDWENDDWDEYDDDDWDDDDWDDDDWNEEDAGYLR